MPKATGRHRHERLRAIDVDRMKVPGLHADGGALYLKVQHNGARSWVARIVVRGRRRDLGLGGYPLVTLAEAREAARTIRVDARAGRDPRPTTSVPTFFEVAEKVIADREPTWRDGAKSAGQWRASLTAYVYPRLGSMSVDRITRPDVLAVLTPIWTAKPETASRVRQRLGVIFDYAHAHGWRRGDSPMIGLDAGLPQQNAKVEHMAALPYADLPRFIAALRASGADKITKLALEFLILTAARPTEVRNATWSEFDVAARLRTIRAARMKADVDHVVPLSTGAMGIIEQAADLKHARSDLVFPSRTGGPLSDATLAKLARSVGFGHLTAHGFRSTFADWTSETTAFPSDVREMALAHAIKDKTEAAYRRGALLDKRRELMQAWGDYACGGAAVDATRASVPAMSPTP